VVLVIGAAIGREQSDQFGLLLGSIPSNVVVIGVLFAARGYVGGVFNVPAPFPRRSTPRSGIALIGGMMALVAICSVLSPTVRGAEGAAETKPLG
jgi:hypothetical protein